MSNPNPPPSAHRPPLRREDVFVFVVLALALVMRLAWALFTTWREDQAVTIRERDTMAQERVALDQVEGWLAARLVGA